MIRGANKEIITGGKKATQEIAKRRDPKKEIIIFLLYIFFFAICWKSNAGKVIPISAGKIIEITLSQISKWEASPNNATNVLMLPATIMLIFLFHPNIYCSFKPGVYTAIAPSVFVMVLNIWGKNEKEKEPNTNGNSKRGWLKKRNAPRNATSIPGKVIPKNVEYITSVFVFTSLKKSGEIVAKEISDATTTLIPQNKLYISTGWYVKKL